MIYMLAGAVVRISAERVFYTKAGREVTGRPQRSGTGKPGRGGARNERARDGLEVERNEERARVFAPSRPVPDYQSAPHGVTP
ncbi:hypothetical protein OH491_10480 [Termitidicoccus mucosus]|uniref:Uncharacterized protein n=1 Tax=Termitidicoccus mucosus TaxID=1184151 RepID=A0A178IH45_9BACT|nr:hypothetical protein AW736_16870 [Opitutaceae bacterium TSB47]